ncbi:hypothetical protein DFJ77DRAFT_546323 [Powellomyces hirtus]|nr:hypothetical protein DFJ77DRAFT_546323 [Powellomyces hirtus]
MSCLVYTIKPGKVNSNDYGYVHSESSSTFFPFHHQLPCSAPPTNKGWKAPLLFAGNSQDYLLAQNSFLWRYLNEDGTETDEFSIRFSVFELVLSANALDLHIAPALLEKMEELEYDDSVQSDLPMALGDHFLVTENLLLLDKRSESAGIPSATVDEDVTETTIDDTYDVNLSANSTVMCNIHSWQCFQKANLAADQRRIVQPDSITISQEEINYDQFNSVHNNLQTDGISIHERSENGEDLGREAPVLPEATALWPNNFTEDLKVIERLWTSSARAALENPAILSPSDDAPDARTTTTPQEEDALDVYAMDVSFLEANNKPIRVLVSDCEEHTAKAAFGQECETSEVKISDDPRMNQCVDSNATDLSSLNDDDKSSERASSECVKNIADLRRSHSAGGVSVWQTKHDEVISEPHVSAVNEIDEASEVPVWDYMLNAADSQRAHQEQYATAGDNAESIKSRNRACEPSEVLGSDCLKNAAHMQWTSRASDVSICRAESHEDTHSSDDCTMVGNGDASHGFVSQCLESTTDPQLSQDTAEAYSYENSRAMGACVSNGVDKETEASAPHCLRSTTDSQTTHITADVDVSLSSSYANDYETGDCALSVIGKGKAFEVSVPCCGVVDSELASESSVSSPSKDSYANNTTDAASVNDNGEASGVSASDCWGGLAEWQLAQDTNYVEVHRTDCHEDDNETIVSSGYGKRQASCVSVSPCFENTADLQLLHEFDVGMRRTESYASDNAVDRSAIGNNCETCNGAIHDGLSNTEFLGITTDLASAAQDTPDITASLVVCKAKGDAVYAPSVVSDCETCSSDAYKDLPMLRRQGYTDKQPSDVQCANSSRPESEDGFPLCDSSALDSATWDRSNESWPIKYWAGM